MAAIHLGLDCGTQGVKALALDVRSGEIPASARRPLELLAGLPPGVAEQHPAEWWRASLEALGEVCARLGPRRREVCSITVSGQQHGFVALDAKGEVIRAAKLWCDTSTQAEAEEILTTLGGLEGAIAAVGNGIPPGYTISKVLWLKRHEPRAYDRLTTVLLPHDYINFKLSGRRAMEHGDASGTALLDVRKRCWSPLAAAAIEPTLLDKLPPLLEPGEPLGELLPRVRAELDLPRGVLVGPGGGDNMMGAIGTGNVRPGIVTASLGTSGTLYAYAPEPVIDPRGEVAAFCDSTGAWLPLTCTLACTPCLEITRGLLGLDLRGLEELAGQAPAGSDGLMLLPWFEGERTPNLPAATGVVLGVRSQTANPAALARSAYEGAALALGFGLRRLRALGIQPHEIRVTGGGSASPLWLRILSGICETPCVPLAADEGAALGAALQGAWVHARALGGEETNLEALCERHVHLDEGRRKTPSEEEVAVYRDALDLFERCARDLEGVFALHRAHLSKEER